MKILQINAVYGILSTGVTTKQLSDYLSNVGIPNVAIYGLHKQKEYKRYYFGSSIGRKIDILCTRIFKLSGYFSFFSTLKALYIIKKFRPSIIHLRVLHEYFINLPWLLRYISKNQIPTVITLHDCSMYTGGCPYYTINNCNKWKDGCYNCQYLNLNTAKNFEDKYKYLKKIKRLAVVGVSDWVTKEVKESKILGEATIIKRIYNWINLELFSPTDDSISKSLKKQLGISESKFVVLCVSASWSARKRLDDICSVSKILGEEYCFVIIGTIGDNVVLPKDFIQVPSVYQIEELPKYYSMADVFLNLSVEETFGKVTAEALSCGTPAIVYNSTASPELIPNECGYVIDTIGDILSVKNAIESVRKKGKRYFSKSCRLFAETSFNMQKNIEEYIEIYNLLVH